MHLRPLRSVLPALAAGLLLTATAGAASAETLTVKDSAADTWQMDMSSDTESYTPAGSRMNTDLLRTVVKHTATKVVVRGTYAELKKTGPELAFFFRLRTDEGLKRDSGVETMGGKPAGTHHFTKPSGSQELACQGLSHKVDYALNQVTVWIPRACLSNPKWVQVTIGAFSITDGGGFFVDNGQNKTSTDPSTSPSWSAKIHKG